MSDDELIERFRSLAEEEIPLPGGGRTAARHARMMEIGREDLGLARLAEAHWDAVSILAEAGTKARERATYGVWASEIPGQALALRDAKGGFSLSGTKRFCSGAGIVDRALVTVREPEELLVDINLRANAIFIEFDESEWVTAAFRETHTATATFHDVAVSPEEIVGGPGWYLNRLGFWRGACGPAACWAGGGEALVDYAMRQERRDPHTLVHLGALHADCWALRACLENAGREIDTNTDTAAQAQVVALTVRHLVEQLCTDILRRLARAYGPHPLAFDEKVSRIYAELDLYLRQSHAERDLELLGKHVGGATDPTTEKRSEAARVHVTVR
jgi:alkylation response protein AidB-like acyl-CoA dehydrogenase